MLRAAKIARERQVQLRVVRMPDGQDPADLVQKEGAEAMRTRLTQSVSVLEFEVGRVLDDADLDSPEGADRALVAVRELISSAPPRSKVRDNLVRLAADRLDVPVDYVTSVAEAPADAQPAPLPRSAAPTNAERRFLSNALAAGPEGREALGWLESEHLGSGLLARARDHLDAHFDDPLGPLVPGEDDELASLVHEIVATAPPESPRRDDLRLDFLQLERSRLEREMRRASDVRQSELASALQQVKTEMGTAMGQAT
jgi:DNA primase